MQTDSGGARPGRGNGLVTPLTIVMLSTLMWPALQLLIFWLRFRHLPPGDASESLVFLPMGLAAGLVAAVLVSLAEADRRR